MDQSGHVRSPPTLLENPCESSGSSVLVWAARSDGSCSASVTAGADGSNPALGSGAGATFPVAGSGIGGAGGRALPLFGTHLRTSLGLSCRWPRPSRTRAVGSALLIPGRCGRFGICGGRRLLVILVGAGFDHCRRRGWLGWRQTLWFTGVSQKQPMIDRGWFRDRSRMSRVERVVQRRTSRRGRFTRWGFLVPDAFLNRPLNLRVWVASRDPRRRGFRRRALLHGRFNRHWSRRWRWGVL